MSEPSIIARRIIIYIENDTIGDGYWVPTVAQSLQEYASMIVRKLAGNDMPEVHEAPNGNKLTVIGGTWLGELFSG